MLPAYSVSKAASLSLTQSLRALLAGRAVSVYAVLPGPIDTDMVRDLDIPKTPAEDVARATLDGIERGEEEIFPDPMSRVAGRRLARGHGEGARAPERGAGGCRADRGVKRGAIASVRDGVGGGAVGSVARRRGRR